MIVFVCDDRDKRTQILMPSGEGIMYYLHFEPVTHRRERARAGVLIIISQSVRCDGKRERDGKWSERERTNMPLKRRQPAIRMCMMRFVQSAHTHLVQFYSRRARARVCVVYMYFVSVRGEPIC